MTPCHWCFASVGNDQALAHARWHRANNLHAAGCASIESTAPCTCGVSEAPA